jgi:SsrA-binding protein
MKNQFDKEIFKLIASNNKADFDYFILAVYEAGIVLQGTEIKSLRQYRPSLGDSHAAFDDGELFLYNFNIPHYDKGNRFNHYPGRPKKLLLHKRELRRLIGETERKGMTLVPIKIYFNNKNFVKIVIGLAKGKKLFDKRATIKEREWSKNKARILKGALN